MKVSIKETKEFLASIQSVYKDTNKSYWEYQLAIEALEACEHQTKMLPSETHVVNGYEPPKVNDYEPTKVNDFDAIAEQKPEESIDVVRDFSPKDEKKKPVFYSKTFPPTIEERIEALEKKVDELEKRLRNY